MHRRPRVLAGFDPTFVVEDRGRPDAHEVKYTVDAVGNELLLYRDTTSRRQRARDRVSMLSSRAVSALPRRLGAALARVADRAQRLSRRAPAQPGRLTRRVVEYDHAREEDVRRAHVLAVLRSAGVRATVMPAGAGRPAAVVVRRGDRSRACAALAAGLDRTWRTVPLDSHRAQARPRRVSAARLRWSAAHRDGIRLFRTVPGPARSLVGREVGVDVEVWPEVLPTATGPGELPSETDGTLVAPRRQAWTTHLTSAQWLDADARGSVETGGLPHLFDVTGPIDAVYTWVDGEDAEWNARRLAALGVPAAQRTAEATHSARFRSHDELRYSLRSLEMFAPWVRRVHIVLAGQVPEWLDTDHPRLRVVDHREIFTDPGVLPVFNSHAIESQLHHIPELAEQYLYLNDDVFFGRPVAPSLFFHGNGLARFFTSSALMDAGDHRPHDAPVTSAAKNNRAVIGEVFGRRVTHLFQHTPHPQLRSVLEHMEQTHAELFARVAASPFRHPDDVSISSALHHYYAYGMGKAVPGRLAYLYLDLAHPRAATRLRTLLRRRELDVFCLNDSPAVGEQGRGELLHDFLERYYPLASSFELPAGGTPEVPAGLPVTTTRAA
ncbi:stealth conserved region 3 domain-containing protein [Georgenia sp. H159]|uniref:stealth conserved region 3 domain-containing protein n=1 Tax=Georgenia sp. H159 TaxID=3076115 RepID=UPI002D791171|nr:stealth conserved region 3 domain-containing protein [Georgenia sp. H159]